jgi:hypothetical protein
MNIKHHVLNESDYDYTVIFKLIWNYEGDQEKQIGQDTYLNIVDKLEEVREDYGLLLSCLTNIL